MHEFTSDYSLHESYTENDSHVYRTNINLLGLDAYEYPHCAYYHIGSGKAD